jgi:hypothetical protein
MERIAKLHQPVEDNRQAVIAYGHPFTVDVIRGPEHLLFEVASESCGEGLSLGAPCRQGTGSHGHTCFAAVLAGEKSLLAAGTIVMRVADESAMAGEGMPHD